MNQPADGPPDSARETTPPVAADSRAAFLEAACGGDASLRERLKQLLAPSESPPEKSPTQQVPVGHQKHLTDRWMEAPADADEPVTPTVNLGPPGGFAPPTRDPDPIPAPLLGGRYRLGAEIARGGMGAVFRATDELFDREVAVKVLLTEPRSAPELVERFCYEARVTGRLQHPGIPPVHDLGALSDGRPFLVMKLIRGRTLAEHLAGRSSPRDDLPRWIQVFGQMAETVGYAHSRGVVHRDLKPLNVMVGAFGEVQVMDWGLARVQKDEGGRMKEESEPGSAGVHGSSFVLHPSSFQTQAGTVMGTPAYMAPEQARGEVENLTARTDVFTLGVILCEILIGTTPYSGKSSMDVLRQAANAELDDARACLRGCGADPDLVALAEWCLSADPAARPADGAEVARAVAAHQAAVEGRLRQAEADRARGETQLAEQRKRRRVWFALATVFLVGALASAALAVRADQLRGEAEQARAAEAERAEGEAKARAGETAQREIAQTNERTALAAKQDALAAQKVAEVAEGKARADRDLAVKAEAKATADRNRAVEAEADTAAFSQFLVTRVLAACRPEGLRDGVGVDVKLSEALVAAERDLDRMFQNRPKAEAETRLALGITCRDLGKYADAERHLKRAVELRAAALGPDHPATLAATQDLAKAVQLAGRLREGNALLEKVREVQQKTLKLPPAHPDLLVTLRGLAEGYRADTLQTAPAIKLYEQIKAAAEKAHGPDHPDSLAAAHDLADVYAFAGTPARIAEAIKLLERVRDVRATLLGPDHVRTAQTLMSLAAAYSRAKRVPEAIGMYEQVRDLYAKKFGPEHPATLHAQCDLARAYYRHGRQPQGVRLMEGTRDSCAKVLGPDHPSTLIVQYDLGVWYSFTPPRAAEALAIWADIYPRAKATHGPAHFRTAMFAVRYGNALEQTRQWDRAAEVWKELSDAEREAGVSPSLLAGRLRDLGRVLIQAGRPAEAEGPLAECLALYEKANNSPWATAAAAVDLGSLRLRMGRYADAEQPLLSGYAGLKKAPPALPIPLPPAGNADPRLVEAADLLCALYTQWGKPDEAAKWRAERAKYPREVAPRPRPVKR